MKAAGKLISLTLAVGFLLASTLAHAKMSAKEIYQTKAPAVVLIVASQEGSSSASAGTGSIIKGDGTVITNCHVIFDESTKAPFPVVHIFLKPDRVTGDMEKDLSRHYTGKVLSFDKDLDLALLKIENPPAGIPVITLGDPEDVGPGDETVAIGHPEQGGLWTITTGVIGSEFSNFKGVAGKDVFQMETSLNRGNSGGPLFDIRGYQIGVNTAIARQGEGGIAITGVNFALKASVVKRWAGKNNVMLAFGTGKIDDQGDTRVATADKPPVKQPVVDNTEPAPKPTPTDTGDSKGSIKIEDGYGETGTTDQGTTDNTKQPATEVKRPVGQKVKHKAVRFGEHYQVPPHPYSYKRLFTEVDKVRARAQEAFDDLEREEHKRGH